MQIIYLDLMYIVILNFIVVNKFVNVLLARKYNVIIISRLSKLKINKCIYNKGLK